MNSKRARLKMLSIVRSCVVIAVAASLLSLTGCSNRQKFAKLDIPKSEMRAVLSGKPKQLHPDYIKLMEEGVRNQVLNEMQIGLKARQLGYTDLADEAFDNALMGIEQIYGPGQQKADVRSLWVEEGAKIFKGEPYERVMAYYYRGLSYFEQGDYDNARASFRGGQLQDAFAEDDQNRCDFALLMYLDGWCSLAGKDSELARQSFEEFSQFRPSIVPPGNQNLLLVVETGKSPRKVADGSGHSELKFRRGRNFPELFAEVCIDDRPCQKLDPVEDIFWQSSTRGGRQVDKLIGRKAEFRSSAIAMGSVLSDMGTTGIMYAPLFNNSGAATAITGGLSIIGVTAMAIGQSAKPHADTRYWNNLPDTVHLYPLTLSPGKHSVKIRYRDKNNNIIPRMDSVESITIEQGKRNLHWVKSR